MARWTWSTPPPAERAPAVAREPTRTVTAARDRRRPPGSRRRQLRQLRLQPGPVPGAARRALHRAAQRRRRRRRAGRPRRRRGAAVPRARDAGRRGGQRADGARRRRGRARRSWASAWATRRSRRPSAPWSSARPSCCTARPARSSTRASGVLAGLPSPFTATRYHSLAVDPATVPAELEVTGAHAVGDRHGPAAPRAADRGRAVPPRVGADRGRAPDAGHLAGHLRPGAGPGRGRGRLRRRAAALGRLRPEPATTKAPSRGEGPSSSVASAAGRRRGGVGVRRRRRGLSGGVGTAISRTMSLSAPTALPAPGSVPTTVPSGTSLRSTLSVMIWPSLKPASVRISRASASDFRRRRAS